MLPLSWSTRITLRPGDYRVRRVVVSAPSHGPAAQKWFYSARRGSGNGLNQGALAGVCSSAGTKDSISSMAIGTVSHTPAGEVIKILRKPRLARRVEDRQGEHVRAVFICGPADMLHRRAQGVVKAN